jgi:hypothetical protein
MTDFGIVSLFCDEISGDDGGGAGDLSVGGSGTTFARGK